MWGWFFNQPADVLKNRNIRANSFLIAFLFLSIAVLVLLGKQELKTRSERAGDGSSKKKSSWKNRAFWKQASMSAFILYVLVALLGIVASIVMGVTSILYPDIKQTYLD